MNGDSKKIEDIIHSASSFPDRESRDEFLVQQTAGDEAMLNRLRELLKTHEPTKYFPTKLMEEDSEQIFERNLTTSKQDHHFRAGIVIGERYKLLENIGVGGMGSVWVAEQQQPVKRRVAIKLIKPGMDSKEVLARFEAERQALAIMDHPNISRVFDGGITEQGRPYFVMEYVKGIPIIEYCDAKRLSVSERLHLFVQVCQAVQHAHQKGIIHRDLKPTNILIAPYDDVAVPKVIDFGLAKAIHRPLNDLTLHTAHDMVLGTPLYMSPEQSQLNNIDIDTRSDIYSLGVLLYELLTGTTPLEKQRYQQTAWNEVRRIICEEEPPRPSMRISSSQTLASIAAVRQIEPAKLSKLVRGELDWIVMKALDKDRSRRYETANGFALDVQRYLAGEPIIAAPPSAAYLMRKFARKHRKYIATAAAFALLLISGAAFSTWQAIRASQAEKQERLSRFDAQNKQTEAERQQSRAEASEQKERRAKLDAQGKQEEADRQRSRAEEGEKLAGERLALVEIEKQKAVVEKQKAEREKRRADDERRIANAVRDFLQNKLLAQADPVTQADTLLEAGQLSESVVANPTIRELLDRASHELTEDKIEDSFPNQPLIQAEILSTVGQTYSGIGEYEKAIRHLKRALKIHKEFRGPEDAVMISSVSFLASAYESAGQPNLAIPLHQQVLAFRESKLGPTHLSTLISMNNLALAYQSAKQWDVAIPLLVETVTRKKSALRPNHPSTLSSMHNLALTYDLSRDFNSAIPIYEETFGMRKIELGAQHPKTLLTMICLAGAYRSARRLDLALPMSEEAMKLIGMSLESDHPYVLSSLINLAKTYEAVGDWDRAIPIYKEKLRHFDTKLGAKDPETLQHKNKLAVAYWRTKQLDKSIPLFEEILRLREVTLGREDVDTLKTITNLGVNYRDAGRMDEALTLLEEGYRGAKKYPALKFAVSQLFETYIQKGLREKAIEIARELIEDARASKPKAEIALATELLTCGMSLLKVQAYPEAEEYLRESEEIRDSVQSDSWVTFEVRSLLGQALVAQQKFEEGESLLISSYEELKNREGKIPPTRREVLTESIDRLIGHYTAVNRPDEVEKWQIKRAESLQSVSDANLSPNEK